MFVIRIRVIPDKLSLNVMY